MQNGHKSITIKRIAGSLGAEICNVNLKSLDENIVKEIRQAFLEHKVIFFRNQDLTPNEFLAFAEKFGEPVEYPFVKGIDGHPKIIEVLKQEHETTNFGGVWHADTTYLDKPPMGTILLAKQVPPFGGDTLFANQAAAYEGLSGGLKAALAPLHGISSSAKADASKTREDRVKDSGVKSADLLAMHPVIRTHPETGKKNLYVNIAHTIGFEGWTEVESQPLLGYLFQHQVKPE
jgi:taurine dioxygenase